MLHGRIDGAMRGVTAIAAVQLWRNLHLCNEAYVPRLFDSPPSDAYPHVRSGLKHAACGKFCVY
jgi:hypothetical protein